MVPEIIGNDHETNGIVTNLPYCCRKTGRVQNGRRERTWPFLTWVCERNSHPSINLICINRGY